MEKHTGTVYQPQRPASQLFCEDPVSIRVLQEDTRRKTGVISGDRTWGLGPAGAAGRASLLMTFTGLTAGTRLLPARLPVRGP